ncbi:MAG: LysR family transcriptional regulator [Comamonadaceae bacterium]|nr:LysR family transcriptional regulator [Comamonadaceae bacterium]
MAQPEFLKYSKILDRSFGNSEQLTAIDAVNCKHLHYVWAVAKAGGVARAGEHLHLTPPSISGQLPVQ